MTPGSLLGFIELLWPFEDENHVACSACERSDEGGSASQCCDVRVNYLFELGDIGAVNKGHFDSHGVGVSSGKVRTARASAS